MRVQQQSHISLPVNLTQSYDGTMLRYTETFSVGVVKLSGTKRIRIRDIVNQGFYFRTLNAIDTPVTLGILTSSRKIEDILADAYDAGAFTLEADPETGSYTAYNGSNRSILRVGTKGVNPYYPHRFAIYDTDEADYPVLSAKGLIVSQLTLHDAILTQGNSFACDYPLEIASEGVYLYVVPFLASLKKTELACASRISFTLEELADDDFEEGA